MCAMYERSMILCPREDTTMIKTISSHNSKYAHRKLLALFWIELLKCICIRSENNDSLMLDACRSNRKTFHLSSTMNRFSILFNDENTIVFLANSFFIFIRCKLQFVVKKKEEKIFECIIEANNSTEKNFSTFCHKKHEAKLLKTCMKWKRL
jgi:hypothetical protein